MEQLQNKVAVITGATSGIGNAIARAFAEQEMRVILHGRNEEKLAPIARDMSLEYVIGDITHPALPASLLHETIERFGRCDIIVNNAGILETGPIDTIDINKVCEMVRVNVEAAFRVAYTFVRYFKSRDDGDLINISSVLGTKVRATAQAYAATKFAIEALSEGLRVELARTNVRVTCIEPGLVKTEFHRNWETHPSELMDIPVPLTPEDIAASVLYVLRQDRHIRIPKFMILPKNHVI